MGVTWFSCSECGEVVNDYCSYGHCTGCEEVLCENCVHTLMGLHGEATDEDSVDIFGEGNPKHCTSCSPKTVTDTDIMEYLLKKLALSREDCERSILNRRGS